jgi:hypothetical protein
LLPTPVGPGDLGTVRARVDAADAGARDDFGTSLGGTTQHRRGDRSHAADGHPPLAGAVADQVVEEAAVLDQRGVAQVRERADQRIGRHHAPDEVVGEPLLDHLAERSFHDRLPQIGVDLLAQCPRSRERARQGRGDDLGQSTHLVVEGSPGGVLLVPASQRPEGLARDGTLLVLHEQPDVPAVPHGGGVRRRTPRAQLHRKVEIADDLLGEHRDEVGVPREPSAEPRERLGAHRRTTRVVEPLEQEHRQPGTGEIGRRCEPVVPTTDDDDVVLRAGDRRSAHDSHAICRGRAGKIEESTSVAPGILRTPEVRDARCDR